MGSQVFSIEHEVGLEQNQVWWPCCWAQEIVDSCKPQNSAQVLHHILAAKTLSRAMCRAYGGQFRLSPHLIMHGRGCCKSPPSFVEPLKARMTGNDVMHGAKYCRSTCQLAAQAREVCRLIPAVVGFILAPMPACTTNLAMVPAVLMCMGTEYCIPSTWTVPDVYGEREAFHPC